MEDEPRLTLDQHRELGKRIKSLRTFMMDLPRHAEVVAVIESMDTAKNVLDDDLAADFPEEFDPKIYYGNPDEA